MSVKITTSLGIVGRALSILRASLCTTPQQMKRRTTSEHGTIGHLTPSTHCRYLGVPNGIVI